MELKRVLDRPPDLRDFPEVLQSTVYREALARSLSLTAGWSRVACFVRGRGVDLTLRVLQLGQRHFVHLRAWEQSGNGRAFLSTVRHLSHEEAVLVVASCSGVSTEVFRLARREDKLQRYLTRIGFPVPPKHLWIWICSRGLFLDHEKSGNILLFPVGSCLIFGTPKGWLIAEEANAAWRVYGARDEGKILRALTELGCPLPQNPKPEEMETALAFLALSGKVKWIG